MTKKNFVIVISLLVLFGIGVYLYSNNTSSSGSVLGASINSLYSQKILNIKPPPSRKSGIPDPKINAESVILLHESSKYPLYAKNADYQVPIASITKIMTAIITLENYKLDDVVEIGSDDTNVIPSVMDLVNGEKITVQNLLYGLLLRSGNDSALALGTGKVPLDEFMMLMNKKAVELGLEKTKFMDPAGLDDRGHSSAIDVAILFSYALRQPEIVKIISTPEVELASIDGSIIHKLKSSNRLTTGEISLEGVIGGKTGYTLDAGHTLVCGATRDGETLIGVVLKTFSDSPSATAIETNKLLTWGFEAFNF